MGLYLTSRFFSAPPLLAPKTTLEDTTRRPSAHSHRWRERSECTLSADGVEKLPHRAITGFRPDFHSGKSQIPSLTRHFSPQVRTGVLEFRAALEPPEFFNTIGPELPFASWFIAAARLHRTRLRVSLSFSTARVTAARGRADLCSSRLEM